MLPFTVLMCRYNLIDFHYFQAFLLIFYFCIVFLLFTSFLYTRPAAYHVLKEPSNPTPTYTVSLLSLPCTQQFHHTARLYLQGYPTTAAVLREKL